jgi:hypothetical protein
MSHLHGITTASKWFNFKVVIARLDRAIQKELDAPIKSAHDIFISITCQRNNF